MQNNEEEDYGLLGGGQRKTKRAKNYTKTSKSFYIKFFIAILIIEAYFSYNYAIEYQYVNKTKILGNQLNITAASEPFYWLNLNIQREMFFNQSRLLLKQQPFDIAKTGMMNMHDLNIELELTHLEN